MGAEVFQIDQAIPAHHRLSAALLVHHQAAQRQLLMLAIHQGDTGGEHPAQRELQQIAAAPAHRHPLFHIGALHIHRQVQRVDLIFAAVIGTAPRHQQVAVAVGLAHQLVFVAHRYPGKPLGTHHHKRIIDAVGGKGLAAHPHQRAAGIRPARLRIAAAVHAGLQLHRLQAPGQVGLPIDRAITLGITEVVTHTAFTGHRAAVVDALAAGTIFAALGAQGQAAVEVERDDQLCLHGPVAVADFAVGRQVEAGIAPQRFAPAQVKQARARIVRRLHVEIAQAQAAKTLEVEAQGHLLAALAEAGVRGVDQGQVGIVVAPLHALVHQAVARAVVLVAQAQLLAAAAVELALADGGIEHAEVAQAQVATEPAEGQVAGRFGVAFQGQVIRITIAKRTAGHARPVAEIAQGVVTTQGTGGHRKVRQALLQQGAGDVERHRGRDLATEGIGGDHHGLAGTVDERDVGQGIGAGLQLCAVGFVAVDKQVHRRGYRRLTGKLRQGVSDQVRAHGEVPRQLHPAQAHRAAPGQRTTDHVAGLVGEQAFIIGKPPSGVVAPVAVAEGAVADATGEGLADLPGVGQRAPIVEQPHLVPGGEVTAAVIGVVEIHVIVEQGAEAAHGLGARVGAAVADKLRLQP